MRLSISLITRETRDGEPVSRIQAGFSAVAAIVVALGLAATAARANYLQGVSVIGGEADELMVFPNWTRYYAAAFQPYDWGATCGAGCLVCHPLAGDSCGGVGLQVAGLTIVNFGTATSGLAGSSWDIKAVYWRSDADAAGFFHTMTAVAPDMWTWAWNGVEANPNLSAVAPPSPLRIYADLSGTPADNATVQMGIPYDPGGYGGGLSDLCCGNASFSDVVNPFPKTIKYVAKVVDEINAAPGDTLEYTLYYGKPGTGNIQNAFIMDTQPPYTHWNWQANPLPEAGWDPNPGPPLKLGWTVFPAATPVAGGATGRITFQLTVNWGNGDWFESGSGDVAAPENFSLWNSAVGTFPNIASEVHYSNKARTTVMRFLFWKVADRDVVYNCTPTMCDEITYSIFIKNLSDTKTWWNVSVWDTVPVQTNPWAVDCGIEDACVGWTMTPTGCAAGGGGRVISAGKTILTWRLDMPPGMTLTLKWKGKISWAAQAGQTAINKASVLEYGRSNIVGGTGHSGTARIFTHEAPVVLRTTYVSYVSYNYNGCFAATNNYYYIVFYPLHPSSAWQLFRYRTAAWINVNPSITAPAPAYSCNSWPGPGCPVGIERIPQYYGGTALTCSDPNFDFYKLVSNAPLLWEVSPNIDDTDQDSMLYSTSTTLSYCGKTFYTWRRCNSGAGGAQHGDYFGIANTEDQPTTVHLLRWDAANLDWDYRATRTIENGSQYMTGGTVCADEGHWKLMSSDSNLVVWRGYVFEGITDYDTHVTMAAADTGLLAVSNSGDAFYVYAKRGGTVVITNIGAVPALYQIDGYVSDEMLLTEGATPPVLGGAAGHWISITRTTVGAGLTNTDNPHSYRGGGCPVRSIDFASMYQLVKVTLLTTGAAIQVRTGPDNPLTYGGYVFHGLDWAGQPAKTVKEFWHTIVQGAADVNWGDTLVAFCPAKDMAVRFTSSEGSSATYTSTGPDQAMVIGPIGVKWGCPSKWRAEVLSPPNAKVIGMVNGSYFTERGYAAPFLSTGVHYEIIVPPTVFVGQSFWITVVVLDVGGATKTTYNGTTSFSSTDPSAKIQGVAMDTYNYTWNGCGADCGVRLFFNVILSKPGLINLIASDTMDGSITGMATIMVVAADVKLTKQKKITVAASGDTVQFQVCWENVASATAFSFAITDAVPMGTTYVPEIASSMFCWSNAPVPGVTVWYSTATSTTPPGTFTSVPGTGSPLNNTRWLRWTIRDAYVNSSGCVCYKVSVN